MTIKNDQFQPDMDADFDIEPCDVILDRDSRPWILVRF